MLQINSGTDADAKPLQQLAMLYRELKTKNGKMRIRDIASQLGVSEAELIATELDERSFALNPDPRAIIVGLPSVGEVMCLCRNDSAVHERYGTFENIQVHGGVGLVLGTEIDLRLFFSEWHHAFYVTQNLASGLRESFQFFDASGTAILKIYATDNTHIDGFRALANAHRQQVQPTGLYVSPYSVNENSDRKINVTELRSGWSALRDTHEFHGLLRSLQLERLTALQHVGQDYAQKLSPESIEDLIQGAVEKQVPIMVFVNNKGAIQIHSGPVSSSKTLGKWLNILDSRFNLHVDSEQITSCWRVRKPSDDGIITSLEVFDSKKQLCIQFFGARKPGIPERRDWLNLIESLPAENEQ